MSKNDYRLMHVNWASSTTDMDAKQKCDEEGGEDKSEIRTAVRSLKQFTNINYFSK
jgi:hypothetical protein